MTWEILEGECREVLRTLPAQSVHTVVTSPPYYGLRDYGINGQIGLESTPDEYVAALVAVFDEVRRVLRDDGTVWLNLGDSYAGSWGNQGRKAERGTQRPINGDMLSPVLDGRYPSTDAGTGAIPPGADYKAKDLIGIPWLVAFALRADGWYLRSDIIWSKPNPMPESVTDRPTKAHEYVFLLSKSSRYHYDADAIREDAIHEGRIVKAYGDGAKNGTGATATNDRRTTAGFTQHDTLVAGRNKRSVWTVATQPYAGAHFATFPPKLIEPCVLAGAPQRACGECGAPWARLTERVSVRDKSALLTGGKMEALRETGARRDALSVPNSHDGACAPSIRTVGWQPSCSHGDGDARGVVLDPFCGAATTGMVAAQHGRDFVGIELSPAYAAMGRERLETFVRLGYRTPNGSEPVADAGQTSIFDMLGEA